MPISLALDGFDLCEEPQDGDPLDSTHEYASLKKGGSRFRISMRPCEEEHETRNLSVKSLAWTFDWWALSDVCLGRVICQA